MAGGIIWAVAGLTGNVLAQSGEAMPGTIVSNVSGERVHEVGREQPKVGKKVGTPINLPTTNNMMRPYNPANPYEQLQGSNLSSKSVVAPVNGYTDQVNMSAYDQVMEKMKSLVGLGKKPPTPSPNFTPGIFRRDRQREQERWVRD